MRHAPIIARQNGRPAGLGLLAWLLLAASMAAPALPATVQDERSGATGAGAPADDEKSLPIHIPRTETTEVRLVLVPVTVLDGRRVPVLDLQRDEFELLVDGRPWNITTFDAPDPAATAPEIATDTSTGTATRDSTGEAQATPRRWAGARLRTTVALVIDLYQTRPSGLLSAFLAAREFLAGDLPPDTQVGLFAVAHGSMRTMVPFSTDPGPLLAALDRMEGNLALRDTWLLAEKQRQEEIASYILPTDLKGPAEVSPAAGAAVRGYSEEQARRSRRVLTSLQSLAVAMATRTGRKNVVFVGDGLREQSGMNYVGGILLLEEQPTGLAMGSLATKTVSLRIEFRETMRVFRESGVTLSPVSTVGLFTETRLDPDALSEMLGSMMVLARETGGRRPAALNDFGREVRDAVHQTTRGYVLGFRPPLPDQPGTAHDIKVRVRRRGRFVVSHRSEYIYKPDRELGRVQLFAGATLLPGEFSDLPLRAEVRQLPAPGKRADLQIQLSMPVGSLPWRQEQENRGVTEIEVSAVLRGSNGRTEMLFDTGYRLEVDAETPPELIVVQEAHTVKVPPDPDLVIVFQELTSERIGTTVIPVPDLASQGDGVRVSRPGFLAPVAGVYLLTPTGDPLLGLNTGQGLLIPEPADRPQNLPVIAFARVSGLPEGGRVQFCLDLDEPVCVGGGLRPYEPLAGAEEIKPEELSRTQTAWIALDPVLAERRDDLVIQVVDADGVTLARSEPAGRP